MSLLAGLSQQASALTAHNEDAAAHGITETAIGSASQEMWVWDDGAGKVHVRFPWDSTNDVLLSIEKASTTFAYNALVNFSQFGAVAKSSEIGGTPTVTTSWESIQDDTLGILTAANGRFGGGHSAQIVKVTKATHGVTSGDIGKRYSDGTDNFAIVSVPDANTFTLVPAPKTIVGDAGGTLYQPASTSLTALDGQPSLTGCTYAYTDSLASVRNHSATFWVNGRQLVAGEIVKCERLEIVDYHEAVNIRNAYAYFVATGATATWGSDGMGSMWSRTIRYTLHPWRQMEIDDTTRLIANGIRISNAGPYQCNPMIAAGGEYKFWWIPGAGVKTGKSWNGETVDVGLNVPTYHTANGRIIYTSTDTLVSNVPVDHMFELIAPQNTGIGNWTRAHLSAINPIHEDGTPAKRLVNGDGSYYWELASSPKIYPWDRRHYNLTSAGQTFRYRANRAWVANSGNDNVVAFVKSGPAWLAYIAWSVAGGSVEISVPNYVPIRTATLVRSLNGALSGQSSAKLTVSQSADNGFAIVLLD